MKLLLSFYLAFVLFGSVYSQPLSDQKPRKEALLEKRFGTIIADEYRWMENKDDPELYTYMENQNREVDAYLQGDLYDRITEEMTELLKPKEAVRQLQTRERQYERRRNFHSRRVIPYSSNENEAGDIIPSPGEKYNLITVSESNSDYCRIELIDNQTGLRLKDVLMVKFPVIYWEDDESSFLYATDRDGRQGSASSAIFRHVIGDPQSEDKIIYQPDNADEYIDALEKVGTKWFLLIDYGNEYILNTLDIETGKRTPMFPYLRGLMAGLTLEDGIFYFITYRNASNGRIMAVDIERNELRQVVPEQRLPMDYAVKIGDIFYIIFVEEAASRLMCFDSKTGSLRNIALPFECSASLGSRDNRLHVYAQSYSRPVAEYVYNDESHVLDLVWEGAEPPFQLESFRTYYTAHNGRKIPVWILKRTDVQLTSKTPMYIYGYGGYAINVLPNYSKYLLPWLKRGGACAFVTLPGGLEYGNNWHKEGMLLKKINCIDDFAAAARHLISKRYTSAEKLVCNGASNGGTLVGAVINRYPHLFRAAVPEVGVMDMERFQLFTCGKYWTYEFGDRNDYSEFRNLLSLSPYHNIRKQRYPSVLVCTADFDDRVVPLHSFKYVARLQEMKYGPNPVFLYTKHWGSHGRMSGPLAEQIKLLAVKWTFMLRELSVKQ